MRTLIYAALLTMLAQPVWAASTQVGNFERISLDACEKAMADGVYLGHRVKSARSDLTVTDTRFFFAGDIFLISIGNNHRFNDADYLICRVFVPTE